MTFARFTLLMGEGQFLSSIIFWSTVCKIVLPSVAYITHTPKSEKFESLNLQEFQEIQESVDVFLLAPL